MIIVSGDVVMSPAPAEKPRPPVRISRSATCHSEKDLDKVAQILSFAQAASLPLVTITAWTALFLKARIQAVVIF